MQYNAQLLMMCIKPNKDYNCNVLDQTNVSMFTPSFLLISARSSQTIAVTTARHQGTQRVSVKNLKVLLSTPKSHIFIRIIICLFRTVDFLRNLFSKTLGISGEKVLDELTLEGVASYIQSGKCESIINL